MEQLYKDARTLERMRAGLLGTYIDAFARQLIDQGYARPSIRYALQLVADFGRWLTQQRILVSRVTAECLACVEREVFEVSTNKTRFERIYLISSQTRAQAGPAQLLELNWGHWGIENKLHYVRDIAYDEDRCRARVGNTPRTLACLRNFAISLLRLLHVQNIKAAFRDLAANAGKVLATLRL